MDWMLSFAVHAVLLFNIFLGNNQLGIGEETPFQAQELNAIPAIEHLASAENTFIEGKREDFRRFSQVVKDTHKLEGLFALYRNDVDGQVYLEIKPNQLNKNYLGTVTLESGVGESGIYSGLALQDFLFYFRRVNNRLHFAIRNVKFRTNPGEAEERSLTRSFSDSVLYSLPIVSINPRNKNILIDLGDLLMQDFPGLTSLLRYSLREDYRLEENKSYFGEVNSFPFNVEVDSIYGFSASEGANLVTVPDSRALTNEWAILLPRIRIFLTIIAPILLFVILIVGISNPPIRTCPYHPLKNPLYFGLKMRFPWNTATRFAKGF